MGTKTISIMDDAYNLLVSNKNEEESFSDEIRRILAGKKPRLSDFVGLWKNKSKEELNTIEKAIKERRKYSAKIREEKIKEFY